jgi:L-alanine-DL-glutamate epimerase-like enolase superfamily enzyme
MLTRRNLLAAVGGVAAGSFLLERPHIVEAVPEASTELGKVKIRDVKTASVRLTYYDAHLVKVITDAGIYGLGEAYRGAGTLDWIDTMKEEVIGEDPLQVDYLRLRESHRKCWTWPARSSMCPYTCCLAASSAISC